MNIDVHMKGNGRSIHKFNPRRIHIIGIKNPKKEVRVNVLQPNMLLIKLIPSLNSILKMVIFTSSITMVYSF